jgi:hypothetical protein
MTNVEHFETSPQGLTVFEQMAIDQAKKLNEKPDSDPVSGVTYIWAEYRKAKGMSPVERGRAMGFYVDNLRHDLKAILETERNGTTLLKEVNNREYLITKKQNN